MSRITVRAALATLVRERLLIRSAGRGTFVASRQERVTYSALGEVSPHGHEPGAWSVTLLVEDAIADVRSALGLRADAGVTRLSRRRATQSSPCVVETVYLPADRCPQIGIGCELDRLYGTLARDYGIVPTRATLHTEPVISSRSQARQLGIDGGRPIIRLRQTTFDGDGRPFEYVESLVPAVDHSVILVNEGTHPQG